MCRQASGTLREFFWLTALGRDNTCGATCPISVRKAFLMPMITSLKSEARHMRPANLVSSGLGSLHKLAILLFLLENRLRTMTNTIEERK
jgi:hypothetical protein